MPSFRFEVVEDGETLWFSDDDEREIFLSPMTFHRHDGRPWDADEMLSLFPPPEVPGQCFEHSQGNVRGRGVWMFRESDTGPPCWSLLSVLVNAVAQAMLRCTIVTATAQDLPWALEVWRTIVYTDSLDMPALDSSTL